MSTIQTNTFAGVLDVRDSNNNLTAMQVSALQGASTSTPPLFQDSVGTQVGTLCRAWVNFNGTGTIAIRASFNVSSLVDNGTGMYTVNFTNPLADVNYAITSIANGQTSFEDRNAVRTGTRTTSSIALGVVDGAAQVFIDATAVQMAIFR